MTKFHVGDRVRVSAHPVPEYRGRTGTVKDVEEGVSFPYTVRLDGEGEDSLCSEDELRPADIFPQEVVDEVLTNLEQATDPVNHPSHYTAYKGLEVIDLTEQMNFNRGNAVKYIARAGFKDPSKEIEDLQKAVWYLNREIARLEKEAE